MHDSWPLRVLLPALSAIPLCHNRIANATRTLDAGKLPCQAAIGDRDPSSKAVVTLRPYGQRSETVEPVVKADPDTDHAQNVGGANSARINRQSPVPTLE